MRGVGIWDESEFSIKRLVWDLKTMNEKFLRKRMEKYLSYPRTLNLHNWKPDQKRIQNTSTALNDVFLMSDGEC